MARRPELMRAGEIQKRFRRRLKEWQADLDHRAIDLREEDGVLTLAERRLYQDLNVNGTVPGAGATHMIAGALLRRPDLRQEFISLFEARRVWTQDLADHLLEVMAYYRLMETRVLPPV